MKGIVIRPMNEEDLNEILSLEAASFPSPWSRQHFISEINSLVAFPLVAETETGVLAGYICPILVVDEGEIRNVAVRPDMRGRGIGRLLVETAIERFRELGASFISLEVRPTNSVALCLYESCGFRIIGRRNVYYHDGEDALLMEYELTVRKE